MRSMAILESLQREKMLADQEANVRCYWNTVGQREPWWGVDTKSAYKGQRRLTPDSEKTFFASGAEQVKFMEDVLRTHGTCLAALGQDGAAFLDLGAGVGRIALHVAPLCSHLVCVDIAESYLELLRETMALRGIQNYSTACSLDAQSRGTPSRLFHFAYSFLTLQHNPPELILSMTSALCSMLAPGGFALLHVPYDIPGHVAKYEFSDVMQMNFVPRDSFSSTVAASGCVLLAILDEVDFCGGGILNCVYLIRRPAQPEAEEERARK
jgi:SAM-dependent methyltransferase